MSIGFMVYVVVGKLLIFLGMGFPYLHNSSFVFVRKLFGCDLCLGCWIYFVLAAFLHINLFEDVYIYVPVLSEIITGCITSFTMHLISIGWKEKFSVVVI